MTRLALISDMHVGASSDDDGGWMHAAASRSPAAADLAGGLRRLIQEQDVSADILVCPGDLGDKAQPAGIIRAWDLLQSFGVELTTGLTIAATGNHDTDSRGQHTPGSPWRTLKQLVPPFPFASRSLESVNDKYWARGWAIEDFDGFRVLNINSSLHHINAELAERGQVERALVDAVEDHLKGLPRLGLNVLLTHHHPWKMGVVDADDKSNMVGGEVLLEILRRSKVGPWLVLHGHKHVPRVDYYQGGSTVVPVVACGSLSARLWGEAAAVAKNQFYVLDVETNHKLPGVDELAARIEAWSWSPSTGWALSGQSGGLSWGSGFGWRAPPVDCVRAIALAVDSSSNGWMERSELVSAEPRYEYLTTEDQATLHELLNNSGFMVVDDDGILKQIGRI